MLLSHENFINNEGTSPLLMKNEKYLFKRENVETAIKKTRCWEKYIFGKPFYENNNNNKTGVEYKLVTLKNPKRIHLRDAERTFCTEKYRIYLITILDIATESLGDYQQTLCYVIGILLLYYDCKVVLNMVVTLARNPFWNMEGYWRKEAVTQSIDAYVLFSILEKTHPKLFKHLKNLKVTPDTFVQKWFGGLCVQLLPHKYLLDFLTLYFRNGHKYLLSFGIALFDQLEKHLLKASMSYKVYEIVRLEQETKYWENTKRKENDKFINTQNERNKFFENVLKLSDNCSILKKNHIDIYKIDIHKFRERAFKKYLQSRILSSLNDVVFDMKLEKNKDEEDDNVDCELCDDAYAEFYCSVCKFNICDGCHDQEKGKHLKSHKLEQLD